MSWIQKYENSVANSCCWLVNICVGVPKLVKRGQTTLPESNRVTCGRLREISKIMINLIQRRQLRVQSPVSREQRINHRALKKIQKGFESPKRIREHRDFFISRRRLRDNSPVSREQRINRQMLIWYNSMLNIIISNSNRWCINWRIQLTS